MFCCTIKNPETNQRFVKYVEVSTGKEALSAVLMLLQEPYGKGLMIDYFVVESIERLSADQHIFYLGMELSRVKFELALTCIGLSR